MSFLNPISPIQVGGQSSVSRTSTFGTTFSNNIVGGYMQVNYLNDLIYTIPTGTTGNIEYSGNTIPINFLKGTGSAWSPDVLTLNSDNLSSGRRKIGMLVYVREQNQIYQYNIDNFITLWNSATAATGTVVISDFGTTVNNNSVAGQNFINAWTASTIDGVGGYTATNAKWKKYYGTNLALTGGSFNSITGTLTLTNITGGTQSLTGFGSGGGGATITGGTYNQNTLGLNLNSSAGTITIGDVTGLYISAGTYSSSTNTILLYNSTGGTVNITGVTATGGGTTVTGGTYSNNTFTFTNNTGGTYSVSFNTVTGLTVNGNLVVTGTTSSSTISATTYQNLPTDIRTTGASYSNNTFTFTNNTGGTYSVLFNTVTGLTVSGSLDVSNYIRVNTANSTDSIAGTDWLKINANGTIFGFSDNAPSGQGFMSVTNGTVTGFGAHVNNTDGMVFGSFNSYPLTLRTGNNNRFVISSGGDVTIYQNLTVGSTFEASTVSATTYQNLPYSGNVTGSGTVDYIPKWSSAEGLTNSTITEYGSDVTIPILHITSDAYWDASLVDPVLDEGENYNPLYNDVGNRFYPILNEGIVSVSSTLNSVFLQINNDSDHRAIQIFYSIRPLDDQSYRSGQIIANWDKEYSMIDQLEFGPNYYFEPTSGFQCDAPIIQYSTPNKIDVYIGSSGTYIDKVFLKIKYILL